jgi:CHAT domain-containing protein
LGGNDTIELCTLNGDLRGNQLAATCTQVLNACRNATLVHFACHGKSDVNAPLYSAIYLGKDERLMVSDIMTADMAPELVVLSACTTAMSGRDLPNEVVSLATAFIQVGSHGVIASLWPVDDTTTMLLMMLFYDELRGGAGPAVALACAARRLRDASNATICDILRQHMAADTYLNGALASIVADLSRRDPSACSFVRR